MKLILSENLDEGYNKYQLDFLLRLCRQYGVETVGDLARVVKETGIEDPIKAILDHALDVGLDFHASDSNMTPIKESSDIAADVKDDKLNAEATDETPLSSIIVYELRDNAGNLYDNFKSFEAAKEEAILENFDSVYKVEYIAKDESYVPSGKEEKISIAEVIEKKKLREGKMNDLAIEIENAGGKDRWLEVAETSLEDLNNYIRFLRIEAPREIGRGGNFDSQAEIDDAIDRCQKAKDNLQAKIDYIKG